MKLKSLSANTLFHFTKSIESVEGILRNGFYPHYCLEDQEHILPVIDEVAFPMVCFCDIPLSQIQAHTVYYGNYALGLHKEWGLKNKINPVLYTYVNSSTSNCFKAIIDELYQYGSSNTNDKLINFMSYVKNYKGMLWMDNKYIGLWEDGKFTCKDINFYDEREWRYVPNIDKKKDRIEKFMQMADFKEQPTMEAKNKKLQSKKLSFEPKDIKYIIVKKENEILDMYEKVSKIKSDKYKLNDIKKLQTRIISMDHITEDF